MKPCPNEFPSSDPGSTRLALVGESPGADEAAQGRPFCGKSGWLLNQWLASSGLSRSQCFVGNVSQVRPDDNDFHRFEWHGGEVQEGIAALREDLARFRPHIVVALGNAALHLLRHGNAGPPKSAKLRLFQWSSHVGTWRGSLFLSAASFDPMEASTLRFREGRCPGGTVQPLPNPSSPHPLGLPEHAAHNAAASEGLPPSCASAAAPHAFKVMSTYHPAATFREPSFTFPLVSDLKRAVAEARSPLLELPPRHIRWGLSVDELEARCAAIRAARAPVGFDIEGGLGGLQCCSFAESPADAFVIDLMGECLDRPRTLAAIASVLEDASVPKVLWNAAYERAIMEAVASVTLRSHEDPMLAWWERWSELPKGLDFVASILTREPYWAQGIGWDKRTGMPRIVGAPFWTYNALDSMTTLEIWQSPLIRAVAESRTPVAFAL